VILRWLGVGLFAIVFLGLAAVFVFPLHYRRFEKDENGTWWCDSRRRYGPWRRMPVSVAIFWGLVPLVLVGVLLLGNFLWARFDAYVRALPQR
jgi:hypothetical protein